MANTEFTLIVTHKIMEYGFGAIFLKIISKNGPKTYSIILAETVVINKSRFQQYFDNFP
jgi:predicted histidine transporter YuiF (NhaC family)